MPGLGDLIRDRVAAQMRKRFGGADEAEAVPPQPEATFTELPASAAVLRSTTVECAECYSLVLRTSRASHSAAHVADAERAARQQYGDPDYRPRTPEESTSGAASPESE